MAPHLLQQQFVLDRHSGLISHQLHMTAAHFTPGELGIATEDIQPPALPVLGHHGGAKQLHIAQLAAHQLIQPGGHGFITGIAIEIAVLQPRQLPQQLAAPGLGRAMQLLAPKTTVTAEGEQHSTFGFHQARR